MDDGDVLTAKQVKELQKRNAQLEEENLILKKAIISMILHIYADYDKRLVAYKVQSILHRDYGINISVGRVYRPMSSMDLPKMSTAKPKSVSRRTDDDNDDCTNHLRQQFFQDAPNLVWVSDITYLKAGGKWYYLCVVIDLSK